MDCCIPSCSGRECGGDGCGGSCGSCGDEESCSSGICVSDEDEEEEEEVELLAPPSEGKETSEKFACVNITRRMDGGNLSIVNTQIDENLIPAGYSIVIDPFNMNCQGDSGFSS